MDHPRPRVCIAINGGRDRGGSILQRPQGVGVYRRANLRGLGGLRRSVNQSVEEELMSRRRRRREPFNRGRVDEMSIAAWWTGIVCRHRANRRWPRRFSIRGSLRHRRCTRLSFGGHATTGSGVLCVQCRPRVFPGGLSASDRASKTRLRRLACPQARA